MFKKNHDHRNEISADDPLDARLQQMGQKIRASHRLKSAAKTGMPLRVRDAVKPAVHVKHFARAVLAYALCVCLLVGGVLVVPGLFEGGNVAGSQMPGEQSSDNWEPSDTTNPVDTEAPPSVFPPPDGLIKVDAPIYGEALTELLSGKTNVNAAGLVNMDTLRAEGIRFWHENGAMQTMFDNTLHPGCSSSQDNCCAGGQVEVKVENRKEVNDVRFYFDLNAPARVKAYVVTPAIDNYIYINRDPVAWTLYATNDPTLPMEKWTVIDSVEDSQMKEILEQEARLPDTEEDGKLKQNIQSVPIGYGVDAENQGEYQYYCWNITYVPDTALNVDEFALYID